MFNITLTKAEALARQATQVEHYCSIYGAWVKEAVAAETRPELLDDEPHPVHEIHRHIPCGGRIEAIIERRGYKTQLRDMSP